MERLIKNLANNYKIVFDSGRFDNWCVYIVEADGNRNAPFDNQYFSDLLNLSKKYIGDKVYKDFVKIYEQTTSNIDNEVTKLIDNISLTYDVEDRILIEKWFTVIYAGMIAEENKEQAVLKKRIKRLGMHQVLIDKIEPQIAANFSRGKKWRELDAIMRQKGF